MRVGRSRGMSAVEGCCTTSHHKTHSTTAGDEVAVLYAWHPWAGRRVLLHEVIERAAGVVARCSLVEALLTRLQEIPVWMLDPVACRTMPATGHPVASLSALTALHALLANTASGWAALASPESRGDRHAAPSSPNPQPKPATRPGADERTSDADRPAGLVRPAGSDAVHADGSPDPPARRPRRRRSAAGCPTRRRRR